MTRQPPRIGSAIDRRAELVHDPVLFGTVDSIETTTVTVDGVAGVTVVEGVPVAADDAVAWRLNYGRPIVLGVLSSPVFQHGAHTRAGTGTETVTFDDAFAAAPATVVASGDVGYCLITNVVAASFDVDLIDDTGTSQGTGIVYWAAWR